MAHEIDMTISEFGLFLEHWLQRGVINGDTPLAVFSRLARHSVDCVSVKAVWLSPGNSIVVVSGVSPTGETGGTDITVSEYARTLVQFLRGGRIREETPIGVFHGILNNEAVIHRAKTAWIPPGGTIVAVTQFSRDDLLQAYGLDKPEIN